MKYEITSLNTKKTLADSLKKLMQKKPFSKITVSEIIKDCGVNRKTFYYHFENIYELLKWMLEKEAIEVVKNFDLLVDYEEAISFVMDYVDNNSHILNCAYDSIGREEMKHFFYADFADVVSSIIEGAEKEAHVSLNKNYKAFLANFYTEAMAGILIDWMKHKDTQDRQETIDYLSSTLRISLKNILMENESYRISPPPATYSPS